MTSRERFLRSLRGGAVDRFFRYDHGPWPSTRQRWIGEGYPPDAEFGDYFRMDPLVRIMINSGYTDSPYYPAFEQTVLEETDEYRLCSDADGIIKKVLKKHTDTSMPQFLRFPVTGRENWPRMLRHLDPTDAGKRIGDAAALVSKCSDPSVPTMLPICGVFGHPRNLLGDEGLAYVIYDDPGLLEEILANWTDLYVELLAKLTAIIRVDSMLIWEDMCYKGGPLISPEHFRRFMLKPLTKVIQTARRCGVEGIILDTDGDCLKMIPLFLEAGVDCLMPFEVQAGMDVVKIRGEYGPGFTIMGGLDKRALARDRRAIQAEVDRVLPYFLESGRFFPTLDHTVPIDVPLVNFRYYLECVRSYEDSAGR
jgi:uroporphyrinogen decarboxylase